MPGSAQFLVLSTAGTGDPINANSPGTYDTPASFPNPPLHSADPLMAPTPVNLGGKSYDAALPWSDVDRARPHAVLPSHHADQQPPRDQQKVMALMGATMGGEMGGVDLRDGAAVGARGPSSPQPIALGAEVVTSGGGDGAAARPQLAGAAPRRCGRPACRRTCSRSATPTSIASTSSSRPAAPRCSSSTSISTPPRRRQARQIPQDLQDLLAKINADDADNQAIAAAILIKMKVAPAVVMSIPFGGDKPLRRRAEERDEAACHRRRHDQQPAGAARVRCSSRTR